jgi:serine/threonine-protein kinase HipA
MATRLKKSNPTNLGTHSEQAVQELERLLSEGQPTVSEPRSQDLFIVGYNIDANKAWYHQKAGNLQRVAHKVLVRASLSTDEKVSVIRANAARIAQAIYPRAILVGTSAYRLKPVDGVLTITRTGSGPHRILEVDGVPALTIIRRKVDLPLGLAAELVTVPDELGEIRILAAPNETLILDAFTNGRIAKLPEAANLSGQDLAKVIERAVLKHGDKDTLLKRLQSAAGLSMRPQLRRAVEHIKSMYRYVDDHNPIHEYGVFWSGAKVATLQFDGQLWSFRHEQNFKLKLTLDDTHLDGRVPSFMGSLLPEFGSTRRSEKLEHGFAEFQIADRYISNIVVRENVPNQRKIIVDCLEGSIRDFQQKLVFTGTVGKDIVTAASDSELFLKVRRSPRAARVSGIQSKAPAHLSADGVLSFAIDKPFTHILKPAPAGDMASMSSLEWFALAVANGCKIPTENFAIVDVGGDGPALLAERFDIRHDLNDTSHYLSEDFWSITGCTDPQQKYDSELIEVARILYKKSTRREVDAEILLRQTVFSWIMGNNDLHLKNLMMLKVSDPGMTKFNRVELSPAYDILSTYPLDGLTYMALRIQGMSSQIGVAQFEALGSVMEMTRLRVHETIKDVCVNAARFANAIVGQLPDVIRRHELSVRHIAQSLKLLESRTVNLLNELDPNQLADRRAAIAAARKGRLSEDVVFSGEEFVASPRRREGQLRFR